MIAGRVISLKKQITRHQKELANLDATIVLFDPTYRIGSIKPKRTHRRAKLFKLGEFGWLYIVDLRWVEAPLDTNQVVAAVTAAIGQTKADVSYPELAQWLKKHGLTEVEASVTNKLGRGTFAATFFLAALAALEVDGIRLEDI